MRAARGQPPRAPRTLPRGDLSEMMEDSYVETKVEALQDNRVKVTVTVDAKDIDARIKWSGEHCEQHYFPPGRCAGLAPRV